VLDRWGMEWEGTWKQWGGNGGEGRRMGMAVGNEGGGVVGGEGWGLGEG